MANIWDPQQVDIRLSNFYRKIAMSHANEKYTDVNIICEDGRLFKCHRVILVAACTYFESLFDKESSVESTSSNRKVKLENIDGPTFESIIAYVYEGLVVDIDDANVYNLLVASKLLDLPEIEEHCVHYLTEKRVPAKDALRLHLFARRSKKHSIIPATSRFIVQHLDSHFCQDKEFLKVPFHDLSSVLTYVRTTSAKAERALLQVILRWVNNSTAIADNVQNEDERATFLKLTKRVPFRYLSPTDITKFLDAANSSEVHHEGGDSSLGEADESPKVDGRTEFVDFGRSLHVFIATKKKTDSCFTKSKSGCRNDSNFDSNVLTPMRVFSIKRQSDDDDQDECYRCDLPIVVKPKIIHRIRIVESNDHLYCLRRLKDRWTFTAGTTINEICDNKRALRLPSALDYGSLSCSHYVRRYEHAFDFSGLSMCSSKDNVFLFGLDEEGVDFEYYNKELDLWSPVLDRLQKVWKPIKMTSNNDRLYTFMVPKEKHTTYSGDRTLFVAYDPRVRKLLQLSKKGLECMEDGLEGCCSHRGKIFVSEYDDGTLRKSSFKMAVYDPVADKWDPKELQYSNVEFLDDYPWPNDGHRLVSFDNKLWIVGATVPANESPRRCFMWTHMYDSYRENVDVSQQMLLLDGVEDAKVQSAYFEDLVTYKPL